MGNGGKGRKEGGDTGKHAVRGNSQTLNVEGHLHWMTTETIWRNVFLGRGVDLVGPVLSPGLSFPKTRNRLVCSVFLERLESEGTR